MSSPFDSYAKLVRVALVCALVLSLIPIAPSSASMPNGILPSLNATLPTFQSPLLASPQTLPQSATFSSPLPTPTPIPTPTATLTQTLGTVDVQGGRLQSVDGRVTLDLPANAVHVPPGRGTTARLTYTPRTSPQRVRDRGTAMRFDLNLKTLDDMELSLAVPVTLTLSGRLDGLVAATRSLAVPGLPG